MIEMNFAFKFHALYIEQNYANDKQKRHCIVKIRYKFFTCGKFSQIFSN